MPTRKAAAAPTGVQRAIGQLAGGKRRSTKRAKPKRKMSAKQARFFGKRRKRKR